MSGYIKNIYKLHTDISFNNEHIIYKYLTTECKKNNILFDKKIIIPINYYNRYDFGIHIMNDIQFYGKIILYDKSKHIHLPNINVISKHKYTNDIGSGFDAKMKTIIQTIDKKYNRLLTEHNDINVIIMWVYNNYSVLYKWYKLNDDSLDIYTVIGLYYYLGTLEWFHIYILKILLSKNNTQNRIVFGDNLLFKCNELQQFTHTELRSFFNNGYLSHSVLYMFSPTHMTLYDPDYVVNESDNKIDILEFLLNIVYCPLNILYPIQEKTDDNYCIFYCINVIEYVNKLNILFDGNGFNTLGKYINELLPTFNKSVIHHYINMLVTDIKYKLMST